MVQLEQRSPLASKRGIERRIDVPMYKCGEFACGEFACKEYAPIHVQRVQHLEPGDFAQTLSQ